MAQTTSLSPFKIFFTLPNFNFKTISLEWNEKQAQSTRTELIFSL